MRLTRIVFSPAVFYSNNFHDYSEIFDNILLFFFKKTETSSPVTFHLYSFNDYSEIFTTVLLFFFKNWNVFSCCPSKILFRQLC